MKVFFLVLLLSGCVTVDKEQWDLCTKSCESHGGLFKAGKNFTSHKCCECNDGKITEVDLPPVVYRYSPSVNGY